MAQVSCTDGLGYEEIGQAGSQVSSLWITGSAVVEDMISGANVYAKTAMQTLAIQGTSVSIAGTGSFTGKVTLGSSIIWPYVTSNGIIINNFQANADISGGMWVTVSGASGTTPTMVAKPCPTGNGRGALGICLATIASGTSSYPNILTRGFYKGLVAEAAVEPSDLICPGVGAALNTVMMGVAGSTRGIVTMGAGSEGTCAVWLW